MYLVQVGVQHGPGCWWLLAVPCILSSVDQPELHARDCGHRSRNYPKPAQGGRLMNEALCHFGDLECGQTSMGILSQ